MGSVLMSAYAMGLFLQKTNIIRDYREDLDDNRKFWPKEVWSKYATDLSDFKDPQNLPAVTSPPPPPSDLGPKLHLRNDTRVNDPRRRLSNLPLRPARPIRLQLLRHPPGNGHRYPRPRIPQPARLPAQH
jgi:Squalene/phytoene synthase